MPFKSIPRCSVYIRSTIPCVLPCIFGIKYGTPFKELELPYKRNDIERQKYCNLEQCICYAKQTPYNQMYS